MLSKFIWSLVLCNVVCSGFSQQLPNAYNPQLFTVPLTYTAVHTAAPVVIDGKLDEQGWQEATWSDLFTDIEGNAKPKPTFDTRVKMIWNDSCLYVAAYLQEPHLQASLQQHDTIVFHDNDFEIFIDPDNNTHEYVEIEVNALNTIFDLLMPKPYRNGSDALIGYDVQGLQSAVQLQGTLNNSSDTDSGWTVEMAIPFRAINAGFKTSFTPAVNSFYRINFSRVEWDWNSDNNRYKKQKDAKGRNLPEHNWVWSPQGVINMHYPERWGYVFFSHEPANIAVPPVETLKNYLWLVYYKQHDFYKQNNRYAGSLSALQIPPIIETGGQTIKLQMLATASQFTATLSQGNANKKISITEEGRIKQ